MQHSEGPIRRQFTESVALVAQGEANERQPSYVYQSRRPCDQ